MSAVPLVVKLGGSTIAEERGVLREAVVISRDRPVVVVHGGGRRLTEWLDRMGIEHRFAGGLRITDDAAWEVACAVLRGLVNAELVAALRAEGADAVGVSGADGGGLLSGPRVPGLGRVVAPDAVRRDLLDALFDRGMLPVLAPIGLDPEGVPCNVNADDAAAAVARGLSADLVLLTDSDGVRDAAGSRLPALAANEAADLIASGVISGGMIPKVRAAIASLNGGGSCAVIADGRATEALANALAAQGSGTRIMQ